MHAGGVDGHRWPVPVVEGHGVPCATYIGDHGQPVGIGAERPDDEVGPRRPRERRHRDGAAAGQLPAGHPDGAPLERPPVLAPAVDADGDPRPGRGARSTAGGQPFPAAGAYDAARRPGDGRRPRRVTALLSCARGRRQRYMAWPLARGRSRAGPGRQAGHRALRARSRARSRCRWAARPSRRRSP